MSEVKYFEVRDRATFMPVMAVRLRNRTPQEFALLRRAGYSAEQIGAPTGAPGFEPYVILITLDGVRAQYDPYGWSGVGITLPTAHQYIIRNWAALSSGDVVDVEFILGLTSAPKPSEASFHAV